MRRPGAVRASWFNSSIDLYIWLNTNVTTDYGVPPGWLSLSPGTGGEDPVLRWTATEAGLVQVTGEFLPGDSGTEGVAIFQGNLRTAENTLLERIRLRQL